MQTVLNLYNGVMRLYNRKILPLEEQLAAEEAKALFDIEEDIKDCRVFFEHARKFFPGHSVPAYPPVYHDVVKELRVLWMNCSHREQADALLKASGEMLSFLKKRKNQVKELPHIAEIKKRLDKEILAFENSSELQGLKLLCRREGVKLRPHEADSARITLGYIDAQLPISGKLYLPYSVSNSPIKLNIFTETDDSGSINNRLESFILEALSAVLFGSKPLKNRVFYLDNLSRNPAMLEELSAFSGEESSFIVFPTTEEKTLAALDRLTELSRDGKLRFLFIRGRISEYYSTAIQDKIRLISRNSYINNISIIATHERYKSREAEAALSGADSLFIKDNGSSLMLWNDTETKFPFKWTNHRRHLNKEEVRSAFLKAYKDDKSGELLTACPLPEGVFDYYKRGTGHRMKDIDIPIGFKTDGTVFTIPLHQENSFAFLMGSPGSGKSVLLRSMINHCVLHYHPDEVELWLADFAGTGFAPYIKSMPPHIKRVLLDTKKIHCLSFVESLYSELRRRDKLFADCGWNDMDDIPEGIYMPSVLVVIDEFSVLSEALSESPTGMKHFEYLISQGRKRGFRMILCSQTLRGLSGLSQAAKDSIMVRLAMSSANSEAAFELIDMPRSSLGDELYSQLKNLPKYHTVCRFSGSGGKEAYFVKNFYVSKEAEEAQLAFIGRIKREMHPSESLCDDIRNYKDKHPVCISGVIRSTFRDCAPFLRPIIQSYGEKIVLSPGKPCAFESVKPIILSKSVNDNILLFAMERDALPAARVVLSLNKSARLNGCRTELWGLEDDVLLRSYAGKATRLNKTDAIAKRVRELLNRCRSIKRGEIRAETGLLVSVFDLPRMIHEQQYLQTLSPAEAEKPQTQNTMSYQERKALLVRLKAQGVSAGEAVKQVNAKNASPKAASIRGDFEFEAEMKELLEWGPSVGLHFVIVAKPDISFKNSFLRSCQFPHTLAFRLPDDFGELHNSRFFSRLEGGLFALSEAGRLEAYSSYL